MSNTEDFLNVVVQNDWKTSHVKALVSSGENGLEGKITECVDGTVSERKVSSSPYETCASSPS